METSRARSRFFRNIEISWPSLIAFSVTLSLYLRCFSFSPFLAFGDNLETIEENFAFYDLSGALYCLLLFAFFALLFFKRVPLEDAKIGRIPFIIFVSLAGVLGNILFALYFSSASIIFLVFSYALIVVFLVVSLIDFTLRLVGLSLKEIGLVVCLAGCFMVLWGVLFASVTALSGITYGLSALCTLVFRRLFPPYTEIATAPSDKEAPLDKSDKRERLRLYIFFFGGVALLLIAAVFPRLLTNPLVGGVSVLGTVFGCYLSLFTLFVLTLIVSIRPILYDFTSYAFMACAAIFLVSLFLSLAILDGGNKIFALEIIKSNHRILLIYLFMTMVVMVKSTYFSPIVPVGLYGALVLALPEFIIDQFIKRLTYTYNIYEMVDCVLPICLVALLTISISFSVVLMDSHNKHKLIKPSEDRYINNLVEAVSREKGLSESEILIAQLLYKGNSVKKIAQVQNIAVSTVQTHMRSIYRKFDVHSKQEMLDVIDQTIV